jgi:hypothetical protein
VKRDQGVVIEVGRTSRGGDVGDRLQEAATDRLFAFGTELLAEPDGLPDVIEVSKPEVDSIHRAPVSR